MDDVNSNLTESSMEKVELAEVANQKSSSTALEEKEINDDRFQDVVEEHMMNTRHQFNLVQSKSEEAHKLLVQDYKLLEAKRENIKEMSKKVTDVNFKDIVKLNVGGERFETSLDTLTKFPNSLFAMMFSGSVATKQGKDDTYFIDRDGSHFRSILNYLRTENISSRMKENAEELIVEAKYYGLKGLADLLSMHEVVTGQEESLNNEDDSKNLKDEMMRIEDHAKICTEAFKEARAHLEEGQASLKEDLAFLDHKKETFLEMAQKLKDVHFSDVIKLNVGGTIFETSLTTLQKEPDSMLAAMFSSRFEPLKQKDGAHFIDRDGTLFRHVLNYLRMGKISGDTVEEIGNNLLMEAEFYNLQGLINIIVNNKSIKINAGEEIYTASIETLRHDPESLFAKMLVGDGRKVLRVDGAYVFDVPIKHMKELLMFLKDGFLPKNVIRKDVEGLEADAKFFNLQGLIDMIDDSTLKGSSIIGEEHDYQQQLRKWLEEKQMKKDPCLLYSAEDDGWTAAKFHEHCNNEGPTLVLIESEHGCIFGGSTSQSWGYGTWYLDTKSFLFSLRSKEWDAPVIMPSNGNGGINASSAYGPTFANANNGYNSLYVSDNPNTNLCSFTNYSVFTYPPSVPTTHTFLAGAQNFLVKKLEVYAV